MREKFYSFILVFLFSLGFAQNSFILVDGAQPSDQRYCPGNSFGIGLSNSSASSGSYDIVKGTELLPAGNVDFKFDNVNPDIFSEPVDLGFSFSFFGKNYDKVVIGRNGRVVFSNNAELAQLHNTAVYKDRTFSGWPPPKPTSTLPSKDYNKVYLNDASKELDLAQIFFGYTDIIFNNSYANRTVYKYTKNYSSGGKSGFLISIQQMIRTDGSGGISPNDYDGFVWILTTGEIIVRVDRKPTSFGTGNLNNYKAILGIQNEDGTKAEVPFHSTSSQNYNNGNWASENVSWLFMPKPKTIDKTEWFLDGIPQAFSAPFTFTPSGNQVLKAVITYTDGSTQESSVNFTAKTPPAKPSFTKTEKNGCAQTYELNIENYNPSLTYEWFKDGVSAGHSHPFIATVSGNYTLKASNGCQTVASDSQNINITSTIPGIGFNNGQIFELCDLSASKNINLLNLVNYSEGSAYTVRFSDNNGIAADATNGYNYTALSATNATITMTVSTAAGICQQSTFQLKYLSVPASDDKSVKLCAGESSYSIEKFKTDFPVYSGYDVQFSTDGINFSSNPVNPSLNSSVFVKFSKSGFGCSSTLKLNFDFYPEVAANNPVIPAAELQQCASSQSFDLNYLASKYINSGNVNFKFYRSLADAQNDTNPVSSPFRSGMGETQIFVMVEDKITGCKALNIPSFTLTVYKKPALNAIQTTIKQCPGNTVFSLPVAISDYVTLSPAVAAKITYFASDGVTELSASEFAQYDAAQYGLTPSAVISYNSTCGQTVHFNLGYDALPSLTSNQIPVCSETSISKADFIKKIIDNKNYKVTNADGSALAENITWPSLPATISVILEDNVTHCKSGVLEVKINQLAPTVLKLNTVDFHPCDADSNRFDGFFSFDLNSKKSEILADPNAKFEYFDAAGNPISSLYPNKISGGETVTAKVTSEGFCPSFATINLKVKSPSKSSTLEPKYFLCEGSLKINAGSENTIFVWSDGQTGQIATFSKAGKYSVTLTNSEGCSYTHNFEISDENQPKITNIIQTSDKIEVTAEGGEKPYEFFFNGVSNGNNPVLLNPTAKEYSIIVKSAKGCYREGKSVYFITVNNVITPNGDGRNDTWSIDNLNHAQMENVEVIIADRYGKTVFQTRDKAKIIWDGTYNGRPLPTASYWYVVKWYDTETKKNEIRQGWILLKNRD